MYSLLEYSKTHKKTSSSTDDDDNITHSILNSESLDYEANFMEIGVTQNNLTKNNAEVVIPLKYLSNFWRS